jgi:hypothetical protein
MKAVFFFFALFFVGMTTTLLSQEMEGNIVVVTKYELRNAGDQAVPGELDSLTRVYQEAITNGNEYVLEHTSLRHFWGNNSSDLIVIYKVKGWEDVPKANDRMDELFNEKWPTKEARDSFDKAYNKYFTGKHSDEIYREVK